MSLLIQVPKNLIDTEIISLHYDARDKYYKHQEIIIVECEKRNLTGNWKNSDKELRDWWKNNSDEVKDDTLYITEYKYVIDGNLPTLPEELDLAGKILQTQNNNPRWIWWREINLLNNSEAYGISSYGFLVMRRWILDAISDSKYDEFYNKTIQNELRLPTVAAMAGAKLGTVQIPKLTLNNNIKQKISQNIGVGTELSKLLANFGIVAAPNCSCKKRANTMDQNGVEWCQNNIDTIIGWLEEEAKKRKLIFSKTIARILVNKAIRNASK